MEIFTLVLAIWGAVVSTVLVIVEIRRNKPQIIVILEKVDYVETINMNITNSGTRALTLTGFELDFLDKRGKLAPVEVPPKMNFFHEAVGEYPFPFTLSVGEQVSLTWSEHLTNPIMIEGYSVKIRLHDSEGNSYSKYSTRRFNPRWGTYSKLEFGKW